MTHFGPKGSIYQTLRPLSWKWTNRKTWPAQFCRPRLPHISKGSEEEKTCRISDKDEKLVRDVTPFGLWPISRLCLIFYKFQKRKTLVEYQTKTRNWSETFRPLRGFFADWRSPWEGETSLTNFSSLSDILQVSEEENTCRISDKDEKLVRDVSPSQGLLRRLKKPLRGRNVSDQFLVFVCTAIHIPPMKSFWTNFCGLCADLLAFDLNGKWFEDFQVHRSFRKSSFIVG